MPISVSPTGKRAPLAVDSMIADRYRVRKVLGVGGMGEVYRVYDQALGIDVALKVLRSEMAHDESFLQRFRNELLVARQVTHPNVVRIHDLGQYGHMMFMTMDLVEGRSLGQMMEEEGQLEKERALTIIRQVASALAASHESGVVHRDLKPANILLDAEETAYVTDFGIARSLHFSGLTRTGEVLGTPDYLAPEQARGEEVGPHTDIYSLGLIFFEMVSGKRPFAGGTLVEVLAQHMNGRTRTFKELGVQIDPALEAIVARCLAADPQDRYSSAQELLDDIDDLTKPRRRARADRAKKFGIRVAAGVAALALMSVLGALFNSTFDSKKTDPTSPPEAPIEERIAALPAVALLPLANRTGDPQLEAWAEAGIPEELKLPLLEAGAVRVIQGRRVQRALDDLGFAAEDLADGDLQTLADVLEARHLVTGSLLALDDQLQLAVQLVAAESDGVARQVVYEELRPRGELLQAISAAGGAVRQALELPPAEAKPRTPGFEIPDGARQAYYEGAAHRDAGRLDIAREALERATEISSSYAEAWLALAEIHRGQGRSEEALEAAEQAAAVAVPESRTAFEARAAAAVASGRPDLAQAELRTLVERFPSDMTTRVALARAHGDQGQLGEAIEVLDEARQLDPSAYETFFLLGQYSILSGDANTAVNEHLLEAQKLVRKARDTAGEARVLNALGVGHEQLGELDRSIDHYREAASLYEKVGDTQGVAKTSFNLGNLHVRLGDHPAAETFLGDALEIQKQLGNPFEQAKVINAFGVLEEERGRYQEALEHYRSALQIRQNLGDGLLLAESHMNVGLAHIELGNFTDADLNLGKAIELFDAAGSPFGLMLAKQRLGSCHIAQGRWRDALTVLHEALEISRELEIPNAQAVSHGLIGEVAYLQGRSSAALDSYGQALEILDGLGDRRGQVEFTLARAETLLELSALEPAGVDLDQAGNWLSEVGGHGQLSALHRLRAEWHRQRGEANLAAAAHQKALLEAEESGGALIGLEARLAAEAGSASIPALSELWRQTGSLGHVPFQLRSAEALVRAALEAGEASLADDVLRRAQSLVRSSGGYGGAYRLSLMTANLRQERGDASGAVRAEAGARTEVERLLRAMPEAYREGFLGRPGVQDLNPEL